MRTIFPINVAQELKALQDGGRSQASKIRGAMPPLVAQSSLFQPKSTNFLLQMAMLWRQARIDARVAVIVFLAGVPQGNRSLAGVGPRRGEQCVEGLGVSCGRRDEEQDKE